VNGNDATHGRPQSGTAGWAGAFAQESEAPSPPGPQLAEDVVLEAAVLREPLRGRDHVRTVLAAASAYYT
jgi:hypothetical protein